MAVVVSFIGKVDFKDVEKAQKELGKFQKGTDTTGTSLTSLGKKALAMGAAFGIGFQGVQALTNAFRDSIAEANEAIKVNAATAQIIKSTGGAAQVTADQVAALSQKISEQIAVDDELVQSTANLILTFKQVANAGTGLNAVFDRAVMAAQDLAAAGFGDAESAAKMLGKALNDPLVGMTALSRAGVTFTQVQKDQIKALIASNDILGAQKLILREVESQVGGVAAATATASDRFDVMMANLKEDIGLAIMPLLEALVNGLTPAFKNISGAVQSLGGFLQSNTQIFKTLTVAVGILTTALVVQRVAMITNIGTLGLYQAAVLTLVKGIDLMSAAVTRMSVALRAIPWIAVATAIAYVVTELDRGADEAARMRVETQRLARTTRYWADENGNVRREILGVVAANRFIKYAAADNRLAAEATTIYGNAALFAAGATDEQITSLQRLIGAISGYVPMALAAADAAAAIRSTSAATERYTGLAKSLGAEIGWGTRGLQRYNTYLDETKEKTKGTGGSSKDLKDKFVQLGEAIPELIELAKEYGVEIDAKSKIANAPKLLERLKVSFSKVSEAVKQAKEDFDNTASSVTNTFRGFLSIADAADAYYERQRKAAETLKELTEYRAGLTEEATEAEKQKLKELQDAYNEAQTAAATGAQSIVEEFVQQSEKFGQFGEKLQKLLKANLNKTSFMQILEMGADRGGDVADSYLNGNTEELVRRTNETVRAYDQLAQDIGKETANTFYQAGLASAIALLKAFTAAFAKDGKTRKQLKAVLADLEKDLEINIKTNVAMPSAGGGGGGGGAAPSAPAAPSETPTYIGNQILAVPLPAVSPDMSQLLTNLDAMFGPYVPFADGGIVMGPTLGLVGEAGPEAIIPLNQAPALGSTYNITVNAGMGADGADIGRQVVDALKQYQRRNGPVPITVA